MSERKHEQNVKDVSVHNDCVYIELLNGLRLSGPLYTNPVYRDPVIPANQRPLPTTDFVHNATAT